VDRIAARARLVLPALVAAVIQVVGTFGASAQQPTARPLDASAIVLLLAGPVALLVRHRFPVATTVVVLAVLLGYLSAGFPFGPVVVSFVFALVSAVLLGRRVAGWLLAGLAYVGLVTTVWRLHGPPGWGLCSAAAAWLLVILTVGELARFRRERQLRERRDQAEAARRVATEERLRIARDLHDVLAHHVSLINVQAGTALHLLDAQPEVARDALTAIKASSKEVLVELRGVLGVLRGDDDAPRSPTAGLAGLDELVERVRAVGLPVTVLRTGTPRPLPTSVDTATFRIVQEALTNVHRHAGAASATVLVDYAEEEVSVRIDDDGVGPGAGEPGSGNGIPGMRERATALGGRFSAAARPGGGFRVQAQLPTTRSDRKDSHDPGTAGR
jgi:signal transduction histidine kinase